MSEKKTTEIRSNVELATKLKDFCAELKGSFKNVREGLWICVANKLFTNDPVKDGVITRLLSNKIPEIFNYSVSVDSTLTDVKKLDLFFKGKDGNYAELEIGKGASGLEFNLVKLGPEHYQIDIYGIKGDKKGCRLVYDYKEEKILTTCYPNSDTELSRPTAVIKKI